MRTFRRVVASICLAFAGAFCAVAVYEPLRVSMWSGILSHTIIAAKHYYPNTEYGSIAALISTSNIAVFLSALVALSVAYLISFANDKLDRWLVVREKRQASAAFHRWVVGTARARSLQRGAYIGSIADNEGNSPTVVLSDGQSVAYSNGELWAEHEDGTWQRVED